MTIILYAYTYYCRKILERLFGDYKNIHNIYESNSSSTLICQSSSVCKLDFKSFLNYYNYIMRLSYYLNSKL